VVATFLVLFVVEVTEVTNLLIVFLCVNVAGVMGEDTRKRQAEDTIATEENSRKTPMTGLHQKDVVLALSGSLLLPLLRGQQPGMPAHAFATWKISPSVLLTWGSDLSCSFCL
jgi:hypothetical protein